MIAQYEVELEAGLRLSKITGLADDLAIALRVPSVRIVAPIPGKNTVGIEVPNETRQIVRLREVIEDTNGMRAEEYGNLGSALTNGYRMLRKNENDIVQLDLNNGIFVKTNAEIGRTGFETDIKTWGAGRRGIPLFPRAA